LERLLRSVDVAVYVAFILSVNSFPQQFLCLSLLLIYHELDGLGGRILRLPNEFFPRLSVIISFSLIFLCFLVRPLIFSFFLGLIFSSVSLILPPAFTDDLIILPLPSVSLLPLLPRSAPSSLPLVNLLNDFLRFPLGSGLLCRLLFGLPLLPFLLPLLLPLLSKLGLSFLVASLSLGLHQSKSSLKVLLLPGDGHLPLEGRHVLVLFVDLVTTKILINLLQVKRILHAHFAHLVSLYYEWKIITLRIAICLAQ
jgi:hypothetical protein